MAGQSPHSEVEEIKFIPYVPIPHPFIERLIGTIRRECLDYVLCWSESDLERKLEEFRSYYNGYRVYSALSGETPSGRAGHPVLGGARLDAYQYGGRIVGAGSKRPWRHKYYEIMNSLCTR